MCKDHPRVTPMAASINSVGSECSHPWILSEFQQAKKSKEAEKKTNSAITPKDWKTTIYFKILMYLFYIHIKVVQSIMLAMAPQFHYRNLC